MMSVGEHTDRMIEMPEAHVVARQLAATVTGSTVASVVAGQSPHRFAFFTGDPADYPGLLTGRTVTEAVAHGGLVELGFGERRLLFGDGVNLRHHDIGAREPDKHQLLLTFTDGTALSATVSMYGQLSCFTGDFDNPYYRAARAKPSPLGDQFDGAYYDALLSEPGAATLSLKAFLATGQRIPGLGNGVLQDILWTAGLHPRSKVATLDAAARHRLFTTVTGLLRTMTDAGGRDTWSDLFDRPGGYRTLMCRRHLGDRCPRCGDPIVKQAYLGGSVYLCEGCQKP